MNKTNSNPIQGNKPMKSILNSIIALCAIGFASSAKADVQTVESLMMFKVNGADTYRQGSVS